MIKQKSKESNKEISPIFMRAPPPDYGFFSMLDFIRPWRRDRQSEWFLDRYVEVQACYVDADISLVGHSNGTFLATRALQLCPAMTLKNIYFAGSVVRSDFDWADHQDKITGKILKVCGKSDTVVALLPGAMQRLPLLSRLGVGGAGSHGFDFANPQRTNPPPDGESQAADWLFNWQVDGGHGGGKVEDLWEDIADFVVNANIPLDANQTKFSDSHPIWLRGRRPEILFASLIGGAFAALSFCAFRAIMPMIMSLGSPIGFYISLASLMWAIALAALLWLLSKILRFF